MPRSTQVDAGDLTDAFGLAGPVTMSPVARGAMGAVWRLDLDGPAGSRASYAAKELFWIHPTPAEVAREVELAERCRAAGVRSPAALPAPDGSYVVTVPGSGRSWRLYEWVDGETPDRRDPATAIWLVRQLARIHALAVPAGDSADWYHRIEVDWAGLAADAVAADRPWAERLDAKVPRLVELTDLVNAAPVGPGVGCHRDLNGANVIRDRSGRRWLVDWDNCGALEPWRELGAVLVEHIGDHEALARLGAAYRDAGGPARLTGATGFATGLAVWLNYLAEQTGAALDPDSEPDRHTWAQAQVDGLLGGFPTVAALTAAAAVVARATAGAPAVNG